MNHRTSLKSNTHIVSGRYIGGSHVYFDTVADGIYDYAHDDGYNNMGNWIENSARKHRK